MRLSRKNKILFSIVSLIFILFFVLHSTPEIAVRTNIFFSGYFKEGLTSKVQEKNSSEKQLLVVSPPPFEKSTHSSLETYQVHKVCIFFYWADYYGEV
ncbi:hypothetical protein BAU15_06435 [Enterococcus sp. JM4C]|uniref:hypothetical protein n=1 Tax=Candidatus Enterococcus huntleyi TaxID=1857217 RepID=UPI00137AC42A|nr:hypothetical protein [Enterococcus sp. JM4C]KAF1297180.1 hypothetical protein BAU15_06435 [Enterococcus sp. JM4C]